MYLVDRSSMPRFYCTAMMLSLLFFFKKNAYINCWNNFDRIQSIYQFNFSEIDFLRPISVDWTISTSISITVLVLMRYCFVEFDVIQLTDEFSAEKIINCSWISIQSCIYSISMNKKNKFTQMLHYNHLFLCFQQLCSI